MTVPSLPAGVFSGSSAAYADLVLLAVLVAAVLLTFLSALGDPGTRPPESPRSRR